MALGVVEPVWAADSFSGISSTGDGGSTAVRTFDGTATVSFYRGLTLQARLLGSISQKVELVYDFDIPRASKAGNYWLPTRVRGFLENLTTVSAKYLLPFETNENFRTFHINAGNVETTDARYIDFQFRIGSLNAASVTDTEDPRTVSAWRIGLETDIIAQRSNVTILNNVIYPSKDERSIITYDLKKPGYVSVVVFDINGNIIRTIQRGRQGVGSHRNAWDGKNNNGKTVASGIYFIRVVAPSVDEYRKVIVAK